MDRIIYGIFMVQSNFALEVWFSIFYMIIISFVEIMSAHITFVK